MGRREKIIVGLDIGSTRTCTLIAAMRDASLEPIGLGVSESKGVKRGSVVNLESTVDSIRRSVAEAEAMAKCEVGEVYVGISGPHIKSSNSSGVTPIAVRSREITGDDVRRVIETARAVALPPDRAIIDIIPQEFTVDDQHGIGDPIGMVGTRLEVNVHIVTSSTTAFQTIIAAVNRSGLYAEDIFVGPLAAGEAVLNDDEKELGTVLVDIGGGKTSVALYHHGAIRHTVVLPVGGDHFSNDIAVGLRTTVPEAERLKREQGCAITSMADQDCVFEVAGVGVRQARTVAQQVLSDILQPRAEEIIHFVRNEIRNAGYERQVGAGVVMTGGGATLRGFPELAEGILDLPVRVGVSSGLQRLQTSLVSKLSDPEFATAAGLVLYGERRRKRRDFHEGSVSAFRKLGAKVKTLMGFQMGGAWLKKEER